MADRDGFLAQREPQPIKPLFIPAMQRRRLTTPAKLMFIALHALDFSNDTPIIFASHDGEINRSFALWLELFREGNMSPLSFGLAVHNAQIGSWSLFTDNQSEMNALAAGEGQLETALLEAALLLAEGKPRVAVVIVEDPLEAQYCVRHVHRAPYPFALALLVEAGNGISLCFDGTHYNMSPSNYHQPLDWIAHYLNRDKAWQQATVGGLWHWQVKHHER